MAGIDPTKPNVLEYAGPRAAAPGNPGWIFLWFSLSCPPLWLAGGCLPYARGYSALPLLVISVAGVTTAITAALKLRGHSTAVIVAVGFFWINLLCCLAFPYIFELR